jgi:hypothetical protein
MCDAALKKNNDFSSRNKVENFKESDKLNKFAESFFLTNCREQEKLKN